MKVSVSKVEQKDKTVLILIEVNDELFASSRECDDCVTLTEEFCKEWLNQGEPEEIELTPYMRSYFWSVSERLIEVVHSEETSLQTDEEKEAFEQEIGFTSKLNPNTPANWIENALGEEIAILHTPKKKHKLVKKQDLPKKVNFEMLVTSPYSIWNGGYEKGETQSITETVQQGELAAQNLELFISLMKNPKFATKASFEIEKILKKQKQTI